MIRIESYYGGRDKELIEFLSTDEFMSNSHNPSNSVIASIIDYQDKTNNYDQFRGSIMLNNNKIVGFLGNICFTAKYKNVSYKAVQTSSAFVNKSYPGNFYKLVRHFIENNNGNVVFTIFPVPKIYSSFEKAGFIQVNHKRFCRNNYIVTNYISFFQEMFRNKHIFKLLIWPLGGFCNIFLINTKKSYGFCCKRMSSFENDYSKIESDYNHRTKELFVTDWNKAVLENKFGNKITKQSQSINENSAIHFCCFNSKSEIVGSIVVKKVRDLKRLIISDIQTTTRDRTVIVYSLINSIIKELENLSYNSLLYFGLEEIYSNIIKTKYKSISKNIDKRVYYLPQKDIPANNISIAFSDDDMNF